MAWRGVVKEAEEKGERQLPLVEGMDSEFSPEELEKARKMLADMTSQSEDLVSRISSLTYVHRKTAKLLSHSNL